ncbi:MAG: hypothetical protein RR376_20700 [Janthinobacterium sp.]
MKFLFLKNQILAASLRASFFDCLLFPQQKKLCISRYGMLHGTKEKGRLPVENLPSSRARAALPGTVRSLTGRCAWRGSCCARLPPWLPPIPAA